MNRPDSVGSPIDRVIERLDPAGRRGLLQLACLEVMEEDLIMALVAGRSLPDELLPYLLPSDSGARRLMPLAREAILANLWDGDIVTATLQLSADYYRRIHADSGDIASGVEAIRYLSIVEPYAASARLAQFALDSLQGFPTDGAANGAHAVAAMLRLRRAVNSESTQAYEGTLRLADLCSALMVVVNSGATGRVGRAAEILAVRLACNNMPEIPLSTVRTLLARSRQACGVLEKGLTSVKTAVTVWGLADLLVAGHSHVVRHRHVVGMASKDSIHYQESVTVAVEPVPGLESTAIPIALGTFPETSAAVLDAVEVKDERLAVIPSLSAQETRQVIDAALVVEAIRQYPAGTLVTEFSRVVRDCGDVVAAFQSVDNSDVERDPAPNARGYGRRLAQLIDSGISSDARERLVDLASSRTGVAPLICLLDVRDPSVRVLSYQVSFPHPRLQISHWSGSSAIEAYLPGHPESLHTVDVATPRGLTPIGRSRSSQLRPLPAPASDCQSFESAERQYAGLIVGSASDYLLSAPRRVIFKYSVDRGARMRIVASAGLAALLSVAGLGLLFRESKQYGSVELLAIATGAGLAIVATVIQIVTAFMRESAAVDRGEFVAGRRIPARVVWGAWIFAIGPVVAAPFGVEEWILETCFYIALGISAFVGVIEIVFLVADSLRLRRWRHDFERSVGTAANWVRFAVTLFWRKYTVVDDPVTVSIQSVAGRATVMFPEAVSPSAIPIQLDVFALAAVVDIVLPARSVVRLLDSQGTLMKVVGEAVDEGNLLTRDDDYVQRRSSAPMFEMQVRGTSSIVRVRRHELYR